MRKKKMMEDSLRLRISGIYDDRNSYRRIHYENGMETKWYTFLFIINHNNNRLESYRYKMWPIGHFPPIPQIYC